jgi:hypothetical protein
MVQSASWYDSGMRQRNFYKTAVAIVVLWAAVAGIIWQIPPEDNLTVTIFLVVMFLAIFLTASVILANSRRGFLVAMGILGSLVAKPLGFVNYLAIGAWWCMLIFVEVWFWYRKSE